ncbi:hypothetical protein [Actinomadura sp. 21ATH]|uniref:hypothetical protein n=1 Tax=Actinomadura sp. 21ATH TaxID=1735444 RepID=UPI0035C22D16
MTRDRRTRRVPRKPLRVEGHPKPGAFPSVDKARVLRYPDLAAKLCDPLIGYARPDQWNGYIPAATYGQQLNTCPRRDALMQIATEAYDRDLHGGTTPLDLTDDPQETTRS